MNDLPTDLNGYGVPIWLDDLSREPLTTGSLADRDASWQLGRRRAAGLRQPPRQDRS